MTKLTEGLTYESVAAAAPPIREDRIEQCHSFGGSCRTLDQGLKANCLKLADRKFAQGGGCQLNLALGIAGSFSKIVVIVHAPLGCYANALSTTGLKKSARALKNKGAEEYIWLHTNMDEKDVVMGAIDKLRETILYAEQEYRPEAIIIANGCVPGIIGEDIDSLVDELSGRLIAKLVPVHCEGFKTKYVSSGYDSAYHGLLRKLVDPLERHDRAIPDDGADAYERFKLSRTVNLLNVGSNSAGDEAELTRLVSALGLTPRVLPLFATIDELSRLGEVALNVSICPTHDDYLIGHLKERFGTEYLINVLPIGIKNTNRWLLNIAEYFHLEKEAQKLIALETAQLEAALEEFRPVLQGKSIFLGGGESRLLTTAEFFQYLGLKVIGLKSHNYDRFAGEMIGDIEDQDTYMTVGAGQPAEELNLLRKLKPDLYIGHTNANGWVTKLGISNLPLYGQSLTYMGYAGAYDLARKAAKVIKNTSFIRKISANATLPFRPEWWAENPFDNIKDKDIPGVEPVQIREAI
jgi:nitrogenase molybdenum-iron protein alpha chain